MTAGFSTLDAFLGKVITQIINPALLLLCAIAFVIFLWGVFEFVLYAGDSTKRADGRKAMGWGLVGFVIMFGAYGILNTVLTTFGVAPVQPITGS